MESRVKEVTSGELEGCFWYEGEDMSIWTPPPQMVASALRSPPDNVQENLPILLKVLEKHGVESKSEIIAVLATIGVEVRDFAPINEYGTNDYFEHMYDIRSPDVRRRRVAIQLGNIHPGDGIKFHGRGFVQLTGRWNYAHMSAVLRMDLISEPELTLEPDVAAEILHEYFNSRGLFRRARRAEWKDIRRGVNGGLTHYAQFREMVRSLQLIP